MNTTRSTPSERHWSKSERPTRHAVLGSTTRSTPSERHWSKSERPTRHAVMDSAFATSSLCGNGVGRGVRGWTRLQLLRADADGSHDSTESPPRHVGPNLREE